MDQDVLINNMQSLRDAILQMNSLLEKANLALLEDYEKKEHAMQEQLDAIQEENQKIAKGILSLNKQISKTIDKPQEVREVIDEGSPYGGLRSTVEEEAIIHDPEPKKQVDEPNMPRP